MNCGIPVAPLILAQREFDCRVTRRRPRVIRWNPLSSRTGLDAEPYRWWMYSCTHLVCFSYRWCWSLSTDTVQRGVGRDGRLINSEVGEE